MLPSPCSGATELYEYGWGTSFHFCRYYKGEGKFSPRDCRCQTFRKR